MLKRLFDLDLFLFDEGEGSDGSDASDSGDEESNESQAVETAEEEVAPQTVDEELEFFELDNGEEEQAAEGEEEVDGSDENEKPSFDDLISGEYQEAYEQKLQEHLSRRLKNYKNIESRNDMYEPIIDYIKEYTGEDNIEQAFEKLQSDTLEEIAIKKGYPSVEAYKEVMEMKSAIKSINKKAAPEAAEYNAEYIRQQLIQQERDMQNDFPDFKVAKYLPQMDSNGAVVEQNPSSESMKFLRNLRNGMDIRPAYLDAYYNKIINNTKNSTVKSVTQKIKSRGNRPNELAASKGTGSGFKLTKNIEDMTDAEFRRFKAEKKRLNEKGIKILQ